MPATKTINEDQPQHASPDGTAASAPEPQPRKSRRWLVVTVAVLLALAGLGWGIPAYIHSMHWESTDDAFIEGHVIAISARVADYVKAVHVDDNWLVKEGQVIIELDPDTYQTRYDSARASAQAAEARVKEGQANVELAEAKLKQAKAQAEAAQAEVNRTSFELTRLEALPEQTTAQTELVNARAAATTAQANLKSANEGVTAAQSNSALVQSQLQLAHAELGQAQAALRQAELELSYTTIRAPSDGRVTRKNIEAGSYVSVGQPFLSIVPPNIWVVANYKETELTYMRAGQPVNIEVDTYPGQIFKGHVDSIQRGTGARFSLLPPENATGNYVKVVQRVPVKIVFDDPPEKLPLLVPGMSVVPEVKVR